LQLKDGQPTRNEDVGYDAAVLHVSTMCIGG